MATRKPSKAEVAFALTFLRAAGVHNAHTKGYLIVAVIAWRRDGMKFDKSLWQSAYRVLRKLKKIAGGASVLRTLRQYVAPSDKEQGGQAVRFLSVLALTGWDKDHYGIMPNPDGSLNMATSRLYAIYYKLLGTKGWSIPQPQPKPPPAPKPPKPKYIQPGSQLHPVAKVEYLSPYGAYNFYMERNRPVEVPPPDLMLD